MTEPTVLLIVPPNVPARDLAASDGYATVHLASLPMGVLSITSYCRAHVGGHWTILDLNLHLDWLQHVPVRSGIPGTEEVSDADAYVAALASMLGEAMKGRTPDVVGVSCIFNAQAGYLGPLTQAARALWPNTVIVAGGGFPTNMPKETHRLAPALDITIPGEAERGFLVLLRDLVRSGSAWVSTPIENLDDIPPLAYDLVDMERYQDVTRFHGGRGRVASVMFSRGCPYSCRFCASSTVHGKLLRRHSVERIVSDVHALIDRYGVDTLIIEDDNFIADQRWALSVLRELTPLHLSLEFASGLAVHAINAEIARAMRAAGAKTATLAVESGCERVLRDIIHKPWSDLDRVRRAVELLRAEEMYVRAFFVIGHPGETIPEMEQTGRFMREIGVNWCAIMIATPIAGSEYYRICRERGWLATDNLEDYHYGRCSIRTPDFKPEQVEALRYRLNLDVNFVHNHDMANGRPGLALRGFRDVLARVPDHAFAHYYAGAAMGAMGRRSEAFDHYATYSDIVASMPIWRDWVRDFGLPEASI